MTTSLIYQNARIYEGLMRALYGPAYYGRFEAIAERIPEGGSVLDVCCGPGTLFHRYLKRKNVSYTGLDINRAFIQRLSARGGIGLVWNLEENRPLPRRQYVIMQSSLYHFLPDAAPIVERMLAAAEKQVLIAEPIRNVADSQNALLAFLARKLTNPGTGDQPHRFNEARLDALLQAHRQRVEVVEARLIAGGREKLYVLGSGSG